MFLIDRLAQAFIATFGITEPTDAQRQRVSWFILGLLVLTVVGVAIAGATFLHVLHG